MKKQVNFKMFQANLKEFTKQLLCEFQNYTSNLT